MGRWRPGRGRSQGREGSEGVARSAAGRPRAARAPRSTQPRVPDISQDFPRVEVATSTGKSARKKKEGKRRRARVPSLSLVFPCLRHSSSARVHLLLIIHLSLGAPARPPSLRAALSRLAPRLARARVSPCRRFTTRNLFIALNLSLSLVPSAPPTLELFSLPELGFRGHSNINGAREARESSTGRQAKFQRKDGDPHNLRGAQSERKQATLAGTESG